MRVNENEGGRFSHVNKWLTMELMERMEQVRTIASMLEASMEDITEHLEEVQDAVEGLAEETEAIDERIAEFVHMIESKIEDSLDLEHDPDSDHSSNDGILPI